MNPQNTWPRGDEYQQAVQQPSFVFSDPDLKKCSAETDQLGLPKPYSGGFTTTYHLQSNSHHFAVRCFIRDVPDLQRRYTAIEKFLNTTSYNFFIPAICLNKGIHVNTTWYPIIKMDWIDGVPLNIYIQKNLGNKELLEKITNSFYTLVQNLEKIGIAHGDLQHGNVIIKNDNLHLIDYDGIFLPSIADLPGNEIGHPNYQHPLRAKQHSGPTIDRFSAIVIYFALLSITKNPKLWNKYDTNENILFSRGDFIDCRHSNVLDELAKDNDLSVFVERFKGVCRCEFDKIPTLDQFISGEFSYPEEIINETIDQSYSKSLQKNEEITSFTVEGYPIIQSTDLHQLSVHIGDWIGLEGVIDEINQSVLTDNDSNVPALTLSFGRYPRDNIYVQIYPSSLITFKKRNISPESFVNKHVRITGKLSQGQGKFRLNLEVPSQIEIIERNNAQLISKLPQKCKEITTATVEEYPVIQSTDLHQLSLHIDDWIRLEGVIDEVIFSSSNHSENNKPLFTLNFGCTPFENISLFIYPTTIDAFTRRKIRPESYEKKTIQVTGIVRQSNGKLGMNLEVPSQIEIIKENNTQLIGKSPQKREEITDFTVEGYPIIQSTDLPQLSIHIGDWIGLEGVIDEINQSVLTDNDSNVPALTLSFGRYPHDNIYVHIYSSSLTTFKKRNIAPESFVNKHVRITGKLSQGQGKFRLNLEVPSQISILGSLKESSQTEEIQNMSRAYGINNSIRSLKDEIITETEANLLNEIYK